MATSRDDSFHRRIAPRICSFARFSRPVPGVKRGSHTIAVALGIDVCTAVQQRQNARNVAGAALLGQRERRAVLAQKRLHLITLGRSEREGASLVWGSSHLGLDPRFVSTPTPQI